MCLLDIPLFITQEWRERIALDRASRIELRCTSRWNYRCPVRGWDVFTTRRQLRILRAGGSKNVRKRDFQVI